MKSFIVFACLIAAVAAVPAMLHSAPAMLHAAPAMMLHAMPAAHTYHNTHRTLLPVKTVMHTTAHAALPMIHAAPLAHGGLIGHGGLHGGLAMGHGYGHGYGHAGLLH